MRSSKEITFLIIEMTKNGATRKELTEVMDHLRIVIDCEKSEQERHIETYIDKYDQGE